MKRLRRRLKGEGFRERMTGSDRREIKGKRTGQEGGERREAERRIEERKVEGKKEERCRKRSVSYLRPEPPWYFFKASWH